MLIPQTILSIAYVVSLRQSFIETVTPYFNLKFKELFFSGTINNYEF